MAPARKKAATKPKKKGKGPAVKIITQVKDGQPVAAPAEVEACADKSTTESPGDTKPVPTQLEELVSSIGKDGPLKKPATTRKSAPRKAKAKVDHSALPHGLSVTIAKEDVASIQKPSASKEELEPTKTEGPDESFPRESNAEKDKTPTKKLRAPRKTTQTAKPKDEDSAVDVNNGKASDGADASPAKDRKPKTAAQYGVKLGATPYPDLLHPTAEEAETVRALLVQAHPEVKFSQPEAPPIPSRTVAGCGEVPCVLEALLRTYLSSHTSMGNANKAIQGLLRRFPSITTGRAVGSVDWDSVRLTPREDLAAAIRQGGMAPTKSAHIKALLDMVHAENAAMREEIERKRAQGSDAPTVAVSDDPLPGDAAGVAAMERLADEILTASPDVLTLDYLHALGAEEAFLRLLPYPGIGVKTAACTLLFCMRRPCFAVDTHVFRLCKWLGWAPENATRDTVFAHCDVRVPDAEKYALHQLMIAHGKDCVRCKAGSSERTEGWAEAECVLETLVRRTDKKADGSDASPARKRKRAKLAAEAKADGEDELASGEEDPGQLKEVERESEEQGFSPLILRLVRAQESDSNENGSVDTQPEKPKSVRKSKAQAADVGDDSADGYFAPGISRKIAKRAAAPKGKRGAKTKAAMTMQTDDAAVGSTEKIAQSGGDDDAGKLVEPAKTSTVPVKRVMPSRKKPRQG